MTLCGLFALWTKSTQVIHGVPGYIQEMGMRKMKEGTYSRLETENVVLKPQHLRCLKQGLLFVTEEGTLDRLDEDQILLACIEQQGGDDSGCIRLPVQDVTEGTQGRFFLGTVYGTTCEIQTEKMHTTAGKLLIEIAGHYPWLWIGEHACLDTGSRKEWQNLRKMVETMRECSRIF